MWFTTLSVLFVSALVPGGAFFVPSSRQPLISNLKASWKPTFGGDGQHGIFMTDPDVPPEVDPTRRDPDEPGPDIRIRLPMVDFGGTKMDVNSRLLKDRIIMIGK